MPNDNKADVNWDRVTTDPDQHPRLLEEEREIGTLALIDYAHSLGLYPPGYPEVDCAISVRWGPDDPDDSEGTLIWESEPGSDQFDDEPDESMWEGVVEIKDAYSAAQLYVGPQKAPLWLVARASCLMTRNSSRRR